METKEKLFQNYMSEYVKLSKEDKRKELITLQADMLSSLVQFLDSNNISYELLKNNEVFDLLGKNPSDEDYLEAMMVYSRNIDTLMGTLVRYFIEKDK